jgi:hypothetical protein
MPSDKSDARTRADAPIFVDLRRVLPSPDTPATRVSGVTGFELG